MGYSVRVLLDLKLAIVHLFGATDGFELRRALAALLRDALWKPAFCTFVDTRELRVLDLLPEDVRGLAEDASRLRERAGPGRSAVLVRDEQDAITVRLLSLRRRGAPARGHEIQAFRSAEDAAAWLGVPCRSLEPA
jgi:hypothetical protein